MISIITPVLNQVTHIEECLLSVLGQDYQDAEHIITDGGSTDGTRDILVEYRHKYPDKIILIFEPKDSGVAASINHMLNIARGEVIGMISSDDSYPIGTLQFVDHFFKDKPEAYFLFGSCNYFDENGKFVKVVKARKFSLFELIYGRFYIYGASAFYSKKVFEKVGVMSTKVNERATCDLDLLIRIGKKFQMHHTDQSLANFRMRQWKLNGESWEKSKTYLKSSYAIVRKYGGIISWSAGAYLLVNLIDLFRPILGFAYPWTDRIIKRIHGA